MPTRTTAKSRHRSAAARAQTRSRSRRRRRSRGTGRIRAFIATVAISVTVLVAVLVLSVAITADAMRALFGDVADSPPIAVAPAAPSLAGYGAEQLGNACTIIVAGRDLGFDERDQTIAVMTAMGESSLRNIDYGDWETSGMTNPDGSRTTSVGLFQQQDSWGSHEARMDPYTAAGIFFRAMAERVPDRIEMEPTLVAHHTQINADPLHYARYWDRAVQVVAALSATPLAGDSLEGVATCPAQP